MEPLAVDSAETDGPLGRVPPGQLGDVLGRGAGHVGGALVVDTLDVHSELVKLRDDELSTERLRDEDVALLQKPEVSQVKYYAVSQSVSLPVLLVELILVQFDVIYSKAGGIHLAQHCNHVGKSGIFSLNTHSLQLLSGA